MDDISLGSLTYLILLLCLVGGYFFTSGRTDWSRSLRHGALWLFIFLGAVVAVGLWSDVKRSLLAPQAQLLEGGRIEVPISPDGHFYLPLEINGTAIRVLVDTGASGLALNQSDARAVGIDTEALDYLGRSQTANGIARYALVRLEEVRLGAHSARNVTASVLASQLHISLLGMDFLNRFSEVRITRDRLILTP